jgi:hypothetical protein
MEVICPCCQAHLLLPVGVNRQSVSCPKCQAVLRAEAGRLVPADAIVGPPPAVPRVTEAIDLPPEPDAEPLDLAIPPGHVFPAQRDVDILRNLWWIGRWMRIVAAADLLSVFVVLSLIHAAPHRNHRFDGYHADGLLCGLIVVGPIATLLWIAGGQLMTARLYGAGQQPALIVGLASGILGGLMVVVSLGVLLRRDTTELKLAAVTIWGAVSLATFLVSLIAVLVRRSAIVARIPERLGELAAQGTAGGVEALGPLAPYRSPQQLVRGAARSLRLACMLLVVWYPLSCCCCASVRSEIRHGSLFWVSLLWAAGLLPLALMLGAAYYLEELRHRTIVIVGSVAALLLSCGFGIDFVVSLVQLARPERADDVPQVLLSAAVALAGALSGLIAATHALQVVHDPAVRRAFARNT